MLMMLVFSILTMNAQIVNDTTTKTIQLDEVSVVSFYQTSNIESTNELTAKELTELDNGQEPSFLFRKFPSVIAFSDNGTEFGYGYFRIRGLDQTRINATLDGMPWNEAEDFGIYFANSPDLMSSMHSINVERGSISSTNGIAGYAGGISLESTNLLRDTISYGYMGYGSYDSWRTSVIYNSGKVGKNAIHLKATNSQTAGYKDNGWNRSQAFTFKGGHWFNDRHSIEFLSMNGQHRNCQGWIGTTAEELAANPHANENTSDETDHWIQSINKLTYKGWLSDNVMFTSSAYLQFQTGEYRFDMDNYGVRMLGGYTFTDIDSLDTKWLCLPNDHGTYDTIPGGMIYDYGLTHYMYGNMSAVKWYVGDFNFTAGYNVYRYQRQHFMSDKYSSLNLVNVDPSEYYDNTGYKNDVSAFVSANYNIGKFEFNGNVQYRYVDFTYKDNMDPSLKWNENTKWNFLNGGASIDYNINDANKLYARYVHTNREPTRTDMFGGNEYYTGEITTNVPETVNDFELGYSIKTNRFSANLNGFYMKFNNERILNGRYGNNGLPEHITAKESYRDGVELNTDLNITKNLVWSFNGSWSMNKAQLNDTILSNVYGEIYIGETNHILTPTWTINNELAWRGKNFTVGISEYWRSPMYVDMANALEVPDYFSLNVFGNYRIGNVELGARLNNITNRTNYQYGAEGPNGELLYFQEAKLNAFGDIKIYF